MPSIASSSSPTPSTSSGTSPPVTVVKFGSSVLISEADLPRAADEIYRWVRQGHRVVAVVSALGATTDRLLNHAQRTAPRASESTVAAWLSTGEQQAVANLGLALDRAGIPHTVASPHEIAFKVSGPRLDGEPVSVDASAIAKALLRAPVVLVPGYFGVHVDGGIGLLGRGGSDLSAIFLGRALHAAQTRLVKDVDGLYDRDPVEARATGHTPRRFGQASYVDVLKLSGGIVQHKAVRYAQTHGIAFDVTRLGGTDTTHVSSAASTFPGTVATPARPLRVAILGHGTVGASVVQRLRQYPELFQVVGIAVRDPSKHLQRGVPRRLLVSNPSALVGPNSIAAPDVIVELLGGLYPSTLLIERALQLGLPVVSANKAVVAAHRTRLEEIAAESGATLHYSAAVGAAAPLLERAGQLRTQGLKRLRGVINGSTTFILNQIAAGETFADALREARAQGFTEADPSTDIDGHDATHKAVLLAYHGFGVTLTPEQAQTSGIRDISETLVRDQVAKGGAVRLVATIDRIGTGGDAATVRVVVRPEQLEPGDPLVNTSDADNALVAELADGSSVVIRGSGAGGWPTAQAVLADLLDVSRLALAREVARGPSAGQAVSA